MDYKFPCYKCGRELHLLFDRFCCKRLQGDIGESRGKVVKTKEIRRKPKKRKRGLNPELRNAVLKRDKHKCVQCGCKKNLHVHHIVHRNNGGTDDIMNLTTLCDLCHAAQHKGEPVYNLMIKGFWQYDELG